ncbi:hypothetical protein BC829DRAFT_467059 [Chytridium lagenaria]|nr:hypothetical protein BC829DRAFT_467059 [Chytridium lagenaria]
MYFFYFVIHERNTFLVLHNLKSGRSSHDVVRGVKRHILVSVRDEQHNLAKVLQDVGYVTRGNHHLLSISAYGNSHDFSANLLKTKGKVAHETAVLSEPNFANTTVFPSNTGGVKVSRAVWCSDTTHLEQNNDVAVERDNVVLGGDRQGGEGLAGRSKGQLLMRGAARETMGWIPRECQSRLWRGCCR